MKILLKNGTLIDYKTNTFEKKDILIEDETIKKIGNKIEETADKIIEIGRAHV